MCWGAGSGIARAAPDAAGSGSFPHADSIRYDAGTLILHGKPVIIYSASFPYYACAEDDWRDRFTRLRDSGFNAVESWVPWNWHERSAPSAPGDYPRMDLSSLHAWMRMAHEEFGLYTILRPGPGGNPGWQMGGWPAWLKSMIHSTPPEAGVEDLHDARRIWIRHWYRAFARAVAPEQITRKPAGQAGVILIGVDADPTAPPEPRDRSSRAEYLREFGIEVPMFTPQPWPRDEAPPPPLMLVPGEPGHPLILPDMPTRTSAAETVADAAARLDARLREAIASKPAWINLRPFVACAPPPGWQDPELDDIAVDAPIAPDGHANDLFHVARAAGFRPGGVPSKEVPSSPGLSISPPLPSSPSGEARMARLPPLTISRIRVRADDPSRADWREEEADTPSLQAPPPSPVSLYRFSGTQLPDASIVRVDYPRDHILDAWRNGHPIARPADTEISGPVIPFGETARSIAPGNAPRREFWISMSSGNAPEPRDPWPLILRHIDRPSIRTPFDAGASGQVRCAYPMQWAPELAGERERWYAPSIRDDEWSDVPAAPTQARIEAGSPPPYALWARVDFETPQAGFPPGISWAAIFRMTSAAAGGTAYLNGRPLRSLPERPGDVRLLLPAQHLHGEPGARNTLTLLLLPAASGPPGDPLIDALRIAPFRPR